MNDLDLDPADDLRALMDDALADLSVPTARLQVGARDAGRRVRRRRRSLVALGTLAATTIVGLLAVPALAGDDPSEMKVARDSAPSPTPDGAPAPSYDDPPAGWWDMPGRAMRNRLADLLAPTLAVADADLGDEDLASGEKPRGGWVAIDVEDERGRPAGALNVVLYPPFDDESFAQQRLTCPGNLDPATPCTEIPDADGNPIGRSSRWERKGVIVLEQTLLRPDGGIVYAAASNSSDDKWGAGSSIAAAEPPVTAAQLKTIALSSRWTDWQPSR